MSLNIKEKTTGPNIMICAKACDNEPKLNT